MKGFNPHPPLRASATGMVVCAGAPRCRFQSSPAPEGECNFHVPLPCGAYQVFQSSPAPEGECNEVVVGFPVEAQRFQSSPAPEGECNTPR